MDLPKGDIVDISEEFLRRDSMKKGVAFLLCILVFTLAGVSVFAQGKKITIGYAVFNVGIDSYETYHNKIFKEAVAAAGCDLIQLDAAGDMARQLDQIENLIQKKVDVLVVWPVNGKAVVPALKKAFDRKIPVVIGNSPIDESGFKYVKCIAVPDNTQEGHDAAQMMKEGFERKGFTGTKIVVEISGLPGYVTAIERSKGFHDEIAKPEYSDFKLVATEPADFNREKATRVMENLLVKYKVIHGVYATDSNVGIGALNALKEAGREKEVVITDCTLLADGYDAMKEGLYWGSAYQSSGTDAKNTVEAAVKVARGEKVPFLYFMKSPKITADIVDLFVRPAY